MRIPGESVAMSISSSSRSVAAMGADGYGRGRLWRVSAAPSGHTLVIEGVFAHSYKRWRPRLFLRALRKEPSCAWHNGSGLAGHPNPAPTRCRMGNLRHLEGLQDRLAQGATFSR